MVRPDPITYFDDDGRLRVINAPISKANVCAYLGKDLSRWRDHGLAADQNYMVWRSPMALDQAARTFDGVPLRLNHDGPIIGIVTNPSYGFPYVFADLTVWDANAIQQIRSGAAREISPGYRHDIRFEAGSVLGERFDLIQTDIRGDHVAIVPRGRTAPEVSIPRLERNACYA